MNCKILKNNWKLIKETDMLHLIFDDLCNRWAKIGSIHQIVLKIFKNKKLYRYKYEIKFYYVLFKLILNDYNFIIS